MIVVLIQSLKILTSTAVFRPVWTARNSPTYKYEDVESYVCNHNKNQDCTIKLGYKPGDFVDWAIIGLMVLVLLGAVHAWRAHYYGVASWHIYLIPATGLGLTFLVGWCWLRINRTFFLYLKTAHENPDFLNQKMKTAAPHEDWKNTANIQKSTEIRWFFRGKIPLQVLGWFQRNHKFGDDLSSARDRDLRTDLYLMDEGMTGLSPKLREGKFEIKHRIKTCGLKCINKKTAGTMENWLKWKWIYADVKDNGDIDEGEFNEQVIERI